MISDFCIRRPIFASVLSIVVTLAGLAALVGLPIEQYPPIAPPQVTVTTSFPGADAETVALFEATWPLLISIDTDAPLGHAAFDEVI